MISFSSVSVLINLLLLASMHYHGWPLDLSPPYLSGRAATLAFFIWQALYVIIFWSVILPFIKKIIAHLENEYEKNTLRRSDRYSSPSFPGVLLALDGLSWP